MVGIYDRILQFIPGVAGPLNEKQLTLSSKLKWTGLILFLFFVLRAIPLYGLSVNNLEQFQQYATILAVDFGSLVTLGIGPIVTASIVLQLLNGAGITKFNTSSPEGKKRFQGTQKLLIYFFLVFEACVFVFTGALGPDPGLAGSAYMSMALLLIAQIIAGGFLVVLMDEISQKWGIGSGVSLFIVAGVATQLVVATISWIKPPGVEYSVGALLQIFESLRLGDTTTAILAIAGILATVVVFVISVYGSAMKIEIPLSFGRVRGHGIRWPLHFIYTSNIPVILIAALLANISLGATLLAPRLGLDPNAIINWVRPAPIVQLIIQSGTLAVGWVPYLQTILYSTVLIIGSMVFAWFWVQTAGMDARSQAKNIRASGLSIPGFRKDPRVIEQLLSRYIPPLTIMGGALIGILAASADVMGALVDGTSLLLSVMIVYRLYEDLARKHMMDLTPGMRKMIGK